MGSFQEQIFCKLLNGFPSNLVYMKSIKYVNLVQISPVVFKIQEVENSVLAVPVNNTLVCHTSFLADDTHPCVLM